MSNNLDYEFTDLRQGILAELNRLRASPNSYIQILEEEMQYFNDLTLQRPGYPKLETYEGAEGYRQAVEFLRKQKPVNTLTFDDDLALSANDHLEDIGEKGLYTHEGSDGRTVSERIEKYIEWEVACCELIDVAFKRPQDVLISLLVDDGVKEKPHRVHLFREEFTHIGIAVGEHKEYDVVCVMDLVGGKREKGKPYFDPKTYKYEYPKDVNMGFKQKESTKDPKKIKTSFQLQDEDAPDNTVNIKTSKNVKLWEGRKHKVTKKYYTLSDGTNYVVEVEEI